jgi:hypothetical protein
MTKVGVYAIDTSTTLESNKSLAQFLGVCSWLQLVYMYTNGP